MRRATASTSKNSPDVDSIVSGKGHGGHPKDIIRPSITHRRARTRVATTMARTGTTRGRRSGTSGCVAPDPPDPPDPPDCNQASISQPKRSTRTPKSSRWPGRAFRPTSQASSESSTRADPSPVSQNVTWTVSSGGEVTTARASADLGRDCRLISAQGEVDLALEKSVRPSSAMVGERIEYTIAVRNVGDTTARAITVLDRQLDARVEVLSATTATGRCDIRGRGTANQRVFCGLRDLGPGESATIVVAARALEPGVARNRATVVSVPPDVGANNSDTAAATIRARQQQVSPGGAGKRPKPPFTG